MEHLATTRWESLAVPESLYSEHWPLAYEAVRRGWLISEYGDYIAADDFFGRLLEHDVSFYDAPEDSGVDFVTLDWGTYTL